MLRKGSKKVFLLIFFLLTIATSGFSTTIFDTYWGSNRAQDVYGMNYYYDVTKAEIYENGNDLIIDIYSRYFDNIGSHYTALGDLLLSTDGWNPDPNNTSTNNYNTDDASNGEAWEWGLALDDYSAASGSLLFYNPVSILTSDDVYGPGGLGIDTDYYRNNQEVRVNRDESTLDDSVTGFWSLNNIGGVDTDDFLRFSINNYYAALDSKNLGFHWAMTCGNDVIEGGVVIPEPSTVILLGIGLLGLGIYGRRRQKRLL